MREWSSLNILGDCEITSCLHFFKHNLRSEQWQNSHPHTLSLTSISEKKEVLVLRSLETLLGKHRGNESPRVEVCMCVVEMRWPKPWTDYRTAQTWCASTEGLKLQIHNYRSKARVKVNRSKPISAFRSIWVLYS